MSSPHSFPQPITDSVSSSLLGTHEKWPGVSSTPQPLRPNRRNDEKWCSEPLARERRVFFRKRRHVTAEGVSNGAIEPDVTVFGLSVLALRWLCHSTHVVLVVLHVILLGVYIPRLEHHVVVSITSSHAWLPTLLSVCLQAFYTLYSMILVTVTQRLGLLRELHRRQKLTTLADASSAWSGLGSALVGLWNNVRLPAGLFSSAIITMYLLCVLVLHVVSSSIMALEPFNQTVTTSVSTKLGWPSSETLLNLSAGVAYNEGGPNWQIIDALVPGVGQLDAYNVQGLYASTVFDTIQLPNSATGTARVNATTIGSTCGLLPGKNVSVGALKSHAQLQWNGVGEATPFLVPWVDQVLFSEQMSNMILTDSHLPGAYKADVVYMLTTGLSSSSSAFLNETFGVSMNWTSNPLGTMMNTSVQVFFAGCSMFSRSGTVDVDVQTNALQGSVPSVSDEVQREWEGLPEGGYDTSANFTWLWKAVLESPLANIGMTNALQQTYTPTILDYYVNEQFGNNLQYPAQEEELMSAMPPPDPKISLELTQLENALATMVAGALWTAGRVSSGYVPETGEAVVSENVLVWRLNINLTPLLFAFSASVIMMLLAIRLVGLRGHDHPVVSSVGILEMMWLCGREAPFGETFDEVEKPTSSNLRAAGMFEVRLSESFDEVSRAERKMEGED